MICAICSTYSDGDTCECCGCEPPDPVYLAVWIAIIGALVALWAALS